MDTLLNASLSAAGSPSEVKARINDQVKLAGESGERAAVLGAARAFVEKSLVDVSEDKTIAVSASVVITVTDEPAIVTAKNQAILDAKDAAERVAEGLRGELAKLKEELAKALTPPVPTPAAVVGSIAPAGTTPCPICTEPVMIKGGITENPDGTPHSCPPKAG